jgi:hypothetical protein
VTDQSALTIKSLRYAARTYIKHQRDADKLPTLVQIGPRKYVLWDGNHRTTIGLMIDPTLRHPLPRDSSAESQKRLDPPRETWLTDCAKTTNRHQITSSS